MVRLSEVLAEIKAIDLSVILQDESESFIEMLNNPNLNRNFVKRKWQKCFTLRELCVCLKNTPLENIDIEKQKIKYDNKWFKFARIDETHFCFIDSLTDG